ncbi:MAG: 16S rRNA (uracil(1498)-N(3))-methyltransferase [Desulfobulbaceae bacterium]|jgi:RsmE family RNA methyltransferase|nr:16S rRNA (uracil(1498)-N(3))-methyltransferase [Desulfobulbaceae bacterium]
MNIILAEAREIAGDMLDLADDRANHIVKVLRAKPGDRLRCGLIDGAMGFGEIISLREKSPRRALLRLTLNTPMPPRPPIDVVAALARPIMMRRLCSQLTALGMGELRILNTARVEKSFWESSFITEKHYLAHLRRGLEQAVDTRMPTVHSHRSFDCFIKEILPRLASCYQAMILAHPGGASASLANLVRPDGRYLLFVGPEGGWLDEEIISLTDGACHIASMGERILRVDTAAVALHARVSQLMATVGGK